ncbi:DUF6894 family protein [Sphingomonas qilianensis]
MPRFYFYLIECDSVTDDLEGRTFADVSAAVADAIRQIRCMLSLEIVEFGQIALDRAIDIRCPDGSARRIDFSDAVKVLAHVA